MRMIMETSVGEPLHRGAEILEDDLFIYMAAIRDHVIAGDEDIADARIAAGEYPGIEHRVIRSSDEGRMLVIEHSDVGAKTLRQRADRLRHGSGAALERRIEQAAA